MTYIPRCILFVCLGNICRSPAAEGVFRVLAEKAGLPEAAVCDSCGTAGWHAGELADPRMRTAAARRGYDLLHRARPVRDADFTGFDLILPMDEDNYATLLRRCPDEKLKKRIKPFADYCRKTTPTHIPDPYYGGEDGFEHVLDLLEEGCAALVEELKQERG